jgi:chitinase
MRSNTRSRFVLTAFAPLAFLCFTGAAQPVTAPDADSSFSVIAYAHGDMRAVNLHHPEKLSQVIYCFLHLRNGLLALSDPRDSTSIAQLVGLKARYPHLKVILSLGGWGGCSPCSETFSTEQGRERFSASAFDVIRRHHADGLDLDWEFPAIEGYPGHRYAPEDRRNFTLLVKSLRRKFDSTYLLSFAAGGFSKYLEEAVEWRTVVPLVDNVNLMTYDLVNGYSTWTGHHTPLYSTKSQIESTDHVIRFLDSLGVDRHKLVIGAAFYARIWENVDSINNGLYRPGRFAAYIGFSDFATWLGPGSGFLTLRDTVAGAPYSYNPEKRLFATYDDRESIRRKTKYALKHGLGGIMFWQLTSDDPEGGLLDAIDEARTSKPTR